MKYESEFDVEFIAKMKALGLRPVVRWLPDTSDPAFMERYRQACATLAASAQVKSEIAWWERLQTDEGWV